MLIKKICEVCRNEFEIPHWRKNAAKYCSKECLYKALHGKNNCVCPNCGKPFHAKPSHLKHYGNSFGNYCSVECLTEARKKLFKGEKNHQFGLKGHLNSSFLGSVIIQKNHNELERMIYCPDHPYCNKSGRVKEHRLVVEQNYKLYDSKYFVLINGHYYLLPTISVHHKDGDHNNNNIDNLIPCTRGEHKKFHKSIIAKRDNLGRIIETAVIKQGELLENPEVGNQQPSLGSASKYQEGSETNR